MILALILVQTAGHSCTEDKHLQGWAADSPIAPQLEKCELHMVVVDGGVLACND